MAGAEAGAMAGTCTFTEFGADFDVVKGFALLPDEYTAGPELGAAADIGALYVD